MYFCATHKELLVIRILVRGVFSGRHRDMSPRGHRRRSAAPVGAHDGSVAPEEPSIHKDADNVYSTTAPPTRRSSEGAIEPRGRISVFLAPCIHVSAVINDSRRPQLIHRSCHLPKRSQISLEGSLSTRRHQCNKVRPLGVVSPLTIF